MNSPPLPRYQADVDRVVRAVVNEHGETSSALREAVLDAAAKMGGRAGVPPSIPGDLQAWVHDVACHAHKTTDEHVAALKKSGYSEDAIFEITIATAMGAALGRYEAALAVLGAEEGPL